MKRLFVSLLLLAFADRSLAGVIPWDGANFYCPNNPPAGVTCCDKVLLDVDNLPGAKAPRTVMQCGSGESFYLRVPYPENATNSWSVTARIGNATTNTGAACWDIYNMVIPNSSVISYPLTAAMSSTQATSEMIYNTSNMPTQWSERKAYAGNGGFTMRELGTANCTNISCDNGTAIFQFKRNGAVNCSANGLDTKTGDGFISEGFFTTYDE